MAALKPFEMVGFDILIEPLFILKRCVDGCKEAQDSQNQY
jgi:hypothetical protein